MIESARVVFRTPRTWHFFCVLSPATCDADAQTSRMASYASPLRKSSSTDARLCRPCATRSLASKSDGKHKVASSTFVGPSSDTMPSESILLNCGVSAKYHCCHFTISCDNNCRSAVILTHESLSFLSSSDSRIFARSLNLE